MTRALVPGAGEAKNKDTLIELMCCYDCVYEALPKPLIRLGQREQFQSQASHLPQSQSAAAHVAASPAPLVDLDSNSSSSDSDAPISKGARRLAMASAAAAKSARK